MTGNTHYPGKLASWAQSLLEEYTSEKFMQFFQSENKCVLNVNVLLKNMLHQAFLALLVIANANNKKARYVAAL